MAASKGKKAFLLVLLLIVAAALAGGGCNGGSSGGGVKSAEELMSDGLLADAAGLMGIFSIPGLDPSALIEAKPGRSGFIEGQEIRMIPSMVYRSETTSMRGAEEGDNSDIFMPVSSDVYKLVGLRANVRYTVEISENRAEPIEAMPVIQVRKWGDKGTETRSDSGTVSLVPDEYVGKYKIGDFAGRTKSQIKQMLIDDDFSPEEAEEIAELISSGASEPDTEPGYAVVITDPHLDFDLSAYPQEDPGIITATFVATSDGDFELAIGGDEDVFKKGYLLCVYEERGDATTGYGYPEIIRYHDGTLLTVDDQIELRRALLECGLYQDIELPAGFDILATEPAKDLSKLYEEIFGGQFSSADLDKMGLPDPAKFSAKAVRAANEEDDADDSTPGGAYDKAKKRLTPAVGQRSSIPRVVNDIRSMSKITMDMGDTFDGVTGIDKTRYSSAEGRAVEFDEGWKPEPGTKARSSATRLKLITTERENEEEMEVATNAGIELAKFSIENRNRVKKTMKYGLTTATLLLRYVTWDAEYSTPEGGFTLSQYASDYLEENGSSEFRKRFGDYFVSGVKFGGRFEAIMTITAKTREKMKEIENTFNTKILAFSASNEFKRNLRDALRDTTIEITIFEEGSNDTGNEGEPLNPGADKDTLIEQMMQRFESFVNATKGSSFRPVAVFYQLTRLQDLNRDGIDEQIDVAPKAIIASRNLIRTMMGLDSNYNVLKGIDENSLINGSTLKRSWADRYERQEISENEIHDIFTSVEKMDARRNELEKIRDEFRVMTERWSFYNALMAAQRSFREAGLHKNYGSVESHLDTPGLWSWGLNDYSFSSAVHENFKEIYPEQYRGPAVLFKSYQWEPNVHGTATKMVAWHQLRDRCYCNIIQNKANVPTVGSHHIHWWFDGKGTRKVDWFWQVRWFEMDPRQFPFRGLEG